MQGKVSTRLYLIIIILLFQVTLLSAQQDSVVAIISSEYDQVTSIHRFWLGDSYRKLYNTPVKMRVLNLSKENGGMQVVKLGGGMQTQSLRLVDESGREWVLRSIQKYPERSLPESLRKTIAKDIVQDQISIAHPYGALTVPTFSKALQIPHAVPQLVFVMDDERLGEYRTLFKNRAYIFEPRTPEEDKKTDNSEKTIRKLLEDNDVQADQKLTLRARLLDMVLGDWDRHEDNWRWSPLKEDGKTLYSPVPRDRDKVYYKTSGIFPTLLSYQWLKAHLQPYSPTIRNISQWNFNARHFDRFFLTHLDRKDWEKEIKIFQRSITDSVIMEAMKQMPDTISKLSQDELITNISSRRDHLYKLGMDYYAALARVVDLPLSAKNEFVDIEIKQDGSVLVDIHNKKKDNTRGRRIFKRHFYPSETEEIRIYGLDGKDEYRIKGNSKSLIKIRLIGGKSLDYYSYESNLPKQHNIYLYDSKNPADNKIDLANKVRYRLANDTSIHQFDYYNFNYDRKGFMLNLNYGVDRGLIVGLSYIIENQGFRKSPYAYKHQFSGSYLTGRSSFLFDYKGKYNDLIAGHNLLMKAHIMGPRNQSNFFGYGNETIFDKQLDDGIKFYRNRYDIAHADILLEKQFHKGFNIFYGSVSELYTSSPQYNDENFFEYYNYLFPDDKIYGTNFHTGLKVGLDIDTRDNEAFAKKGLHFQFQSSWLQQIGGEKREYIAFESSFAFYKSFNQERYTIANRTGVNATWGNPYFYQYAKIGGENSLRGYNSNRFTGNIAFYNNFDLRVKLLSFNSYLLPGTLGAIAFYDVGRVWYKSENSNQWHSGYGTGLYFNPADLFTVQAVVGFSKEAVLPYIRIGLSF